MLNVVAACRVRTVIARIAARRWTKQLLPTAAVMELIGMRHYMSAFMPQDAHAVRDRAAFDLEHHFLFELHQPRMRQKERDGDAGGIFWRKPLARNPGVR